MKMKKILCFLIMAAMLFTFGCSPKQETPNTEQGAGETGYKDELVFCQSNDLTTMDASIGLQERAVALTNHIFDPLFMTDSSYKPVPCLALSYEWVDDRSLKIVLRENVKFHDGSDMTAEDVVFTLDLLNERGAVFEGNYAGCEIVDDHTVLMKLNQPNPAMPYILSMPQTCVLPSDAYNPDSFALKPIGTGPYKLKEFKDGDYYTLERFDEYWGEPAKTQYLTLRIVPEPSQRTILLETGDVDVSYFIPINDLKRVEKDPNLKILTCPSMKVILMELNCESTGAVGNPAIRRAVECAIDKQAIIDTLLEGYGKAVSSIVSPNCEDYRDYEVNSYDPELSKQLMAQAGYPDGFEIKLFTNADQTNGEIAQVMQSQLAQVGIKLNITVQDDNTTFTMVESGQDFDMILDFFQTTSCHANDVFNNMLTSKSFNNYSRYRDDEFDALYKEYAGTAAGDAREALLRKIYEKIKVDVPAISLYLPYNIVVTGANVEGVRMSHIGAHEFQEAAVKINK
ncbi:MAG: ABC transporter substrate-binding protein [Clostridiaceae bacterium]|jgi:peptide/nickel transport system substrate-binding protein|nr:ABC transporter substrate-binding protein [Clostridiaceae bacterium]